MQNLPWYVRILVGIVGFATLYVVFDLWNLFQAFATATMVPIVALVCLGFVSEGAYEAIADGAWLRDLNNRIKTKREALRAADPTAHPDGLRPSEGT